jgi:hypothetical protein
VVRRNKVLGRQGRIKAGFESVMNPAFEMIVHGDSRKSGVKVARGKQEIVFGSTCPVEGGCITKSESDKDEGGEEYFGGQSS